MRITDTIELLILAALWGASFLFMRIAAPSLGAIWSIEIRVLIAGLALLPFLIRSHLWQEIRPKLPNLFLLGCFNSAIPFSLFAFASIHLPAGFNSILNATVPLFGTVVGTVWLKEKWTIEGFVGFLLGFVGVTVLVGWKSFPTSSFFWDAVTAGLVASLMYAISAPYAKKQLAGVPSLAIATISQLSAALFLLPALPFTIPEAFPSNQVIFAIVALALCSTAIPYLLYFRLIKNIGSTKTLTVAYLIPISAMFWGVFILKESIELSAILGCALILCGTAIALHKSDEKK